MWLSCSAVGAVTRFGMHFDDQQPPVRYRSGAELAVADFDVSAELGRRGSSTLDRLGALALLATRDCLADVHELPPGTGVTAATTVGSMRSTLDYSGITITDPKPWNVPPSLFPNTVMNAAAGLVAIRHKLTGPNTTIAGGKAAGVKGLSYIEMLVETQLLSTCLLVCAEELTAPRRAWTASYGVDHIGEAAVALLLETGSHPDRICRMRVRDGRADGGPEPDGLAAGATALVVAGSDVVADDTFDVERFYGVLDAATFGTQVLLALHLLRSGHYARVRIPFPTHGNDTFVEVEL